MSETPETDAAEFYYDGRTGFVETDFCRKLERERDEARRKRDEVLRFTEYQWLLKVANRLMSAGCKSDGILDSLDEVIRARDEARIELERVRKELVDANRGAERNAHINNSLCSKLIQAERERDEIIKQKVLGFNALRSAWSVINHALKEER